MRFYMLIYVMKIPNYTTNENYISVVGVEILKCVFTLRLFSIMSYFTLTLLTFFIIIVYYIRLI